MKKLLLVGGLALGLSMGAVAQKFQSEVISKAHETMNKEVFKSLANDAPKQFAPKYASGVVDPKTGVSIVDLTTSAHGYRMNATGIPRLFVDPTSGAIVTFNVGDQVEYEAGSDFYSYSTNGNDWVTNNRIANADEIQLVNASYPACGIFNPNNSTNPEDLYISFITDNMNGDNGSHGSLSAGTIAFGDSPEGTDHQEIAFEIDDDYKSAIMLDACNLGNKIFTVYKNYDYANSTWLNSVVLVKGEYDETAGKVVYTRNIVPIPEGIFGDSGTWGPRVSFDPTGTVGYMFTEANLSAELLASGLHSWPTHIMKTIDGGETWSDVETFWHNEEGFECLQNRISEEDWEEMIMELNWDDQYPGEDAFAYANLWQTDGFVDNDGNLHLGLALKAMFPYDGSWGNTYSKKSQVLLHLFTETTDDNSIKVNSEVVTDTECFAVDLEGDPGWPHEMRVNLVPTPDRKYAMFLWSDSQAEWSGNGDDDAIGNSRPSIYARGYKLPVGDEPGHFSGEAEPGYSDAEGDPVKIRKNLTFQTLADEAAWYYLAADYVLYEDGTDPNHPTVKIPLKYFGFEGDYPQGYGEPFIAKYLNGVTFNIDPVGINEMEAEAVSAIEVSQNQPNPFSGETTINIELTNATELSVEVSNLTGQTIQVINKGQVAAGSQKVVIDGSNMAAGIYFYTVNAGMNKITKKMVVK